MKLLLENLDCANCASKIEKKLSKIPSVTSVCVNFLTETLTLECENFENIKAEIYSIIHKIDKNINIEEA